MKKMCNLIILLLLAGAGVVAWRETNIRYIIGRNWYILTDDGEKYYIVGEEHNLVEVGEPEYRTVTEVLEDFGGKVIDPTAKKKRPSDDDEEF